MRAALRVGIRREDGIEELVRPLFGRVLHRETHRRDALCKRVGGQGATPACVGADEDQAAHGGGMVSGEQ